MKVSGPKGRVIWRELILKKRIYWPLAGLAIFSAAYAIQTVRVTVNGKPVSGRMIDGSVYVKLADVAKALDQTVVKNGSAYEMVPAGGANMLQGTKGKLGEELFTGKWKFLVKNVERADSYMLKHADSKFEMTADAGQDLVIVHCRFKNAVKESVYMYFNGMQNTALTDMDMQVYKTAWLDVGGGVASTLLPGAAKDFALVFKVPEGAELKDFVYTVEPVDSSKWGMTDLRIALK